MMMLKSLGPQGRSVALMFGALSERASTGVGLVDTNDANREPTRRRESIATAVWHEDHVESRETKERDVTQGNGRAYILALRR